MDEKNDCKPSQVDPLARIVDQAASQVLHDRSSTDTKDSLFFVGNWHDSIPRAIWIDPLLDGTDVRIWGFLRSLLKSDTPAVVSVNTRLQEALGYSKPTITRSLSALRATRWISLCSKVRDEGGRFRGHVYAVNAEPLSFGDAIRLDPGFLDFLEEQTHIKRPKVREIATAVLALINEQIENNRDITEEESLLPRFSSAEHENQSLAEIENHPSTHLDRAENQGNDHQDNNFTLDVHQGNDHQGNNFTLDNHQGTFTRETFLPWTQTRKINHLATRVKKFPWCLYVVVVVVEKKLLLHRHVRAREKTMPGKQPPKSTNSSTTMG